MTTRVRDPQTDPRGPGRHPPVPDLPREAWYQEAWYAIAGRPEFKYKIFRDYVKASKLRGQWQEWNVRDIVKHEEQNTNTYIPDSDPGLAYNFARELRDDWRPAQIDVERLLGFREHPGELENVFFETHWKNLYAKTLQFAEKWFGNDIDFTRIEGCENIWDRQSIFTPQFIEYAKLVGHEDRIRGSWAALLNDPRQRKWLITGILGVVMERKIFDQLLFGAEPELRSELERADDMYLQEEGKTPQSPSVLCELVSLTCRVNKRLQPQDTSLPNSEVRPETSLGAQRLLGRHRFSDGCNCQDLLAVPQRDEDICHQHSRR